MGFVTYTFAGRAPTPDKDRAAWERKIADTTSKIKALFDSGTPIFTKNDLQHVYEQLERPNTKGQKISIRGINGVSVDFEIETGAIYANGPDTESILYVRSLSLQRMPLIS
jgi:hypothetical protein